MTMAMSEPRTASPSIGLLGELQKLESPLMDSVPKIKRDNRLSESAKQVDIASMTKAHDASMEAVLQDAESEGKVLLSSAQEQLTAERAKLQDRIEGIDKSALTIQQDEQRAAVEAKRSRLAIEGEQLLRTFGGDDSEFARWSMSVIEQAQDGVMDARLQLDWLARVGLPIAKNQSTDREKFRMTNQLVSDAHAAVFDMSKIKAAEARILEARTKLDAAHYVRMNNLPQLRAIREKRIREAR